MAACAAEIEHSLTLAGISAIEEPGGVSGGVRSTEPQRASVVVRMFKVSRKPRSQGIKTYPIRNAFKQFRAPVFGGHLGN